jgi:hypothetical protein
VYIPLQRRHQALHDSTQGQQRLQSASQQYQQGHTVRHNIAVSSQSRESRTEQRSENNDI